MQKKRGKDKRTTGTNNHLVISIYRVKLGVKRRAFLQNDLWELRIPDNLKFNNGVKTEQFPFIF